VALERVGGEIGCWVVGFASSWDGSRWWLRCGGMVVVVVDRKQASRGPLAVGEAVNVRAKEDSLLLTFTCPKLRRAKGLPVTLKRLVPWNGAFAGKDE